MSDTGSAADSNRDLYSIISPSSSLPLDDSRTGGHRLILDDITLLRDIFQHIHDTSKRIHEMNYLRREIKVKHEINKLNELPHEHSAQHRIDDNKFDEDSVMHWSEYEVMSDSDRAILLERAITALKYPSVK